METPNVKKIAIISSALAVVIAIAVIAILVFKDKEVESTPDTDIDVNLESENPDVTMKSEEDAEDPYIADDILKGYGLPNIYTIESDKTILTDYTNYLNEVAPLLNGLNVGFSVMHSVFLDTAPLGDAEGIKTDFLSSEPEYREIFNRLRTASVTVNTRELNNTLIGLYEEMYALRKEEAEALADVGGNVLVDYSKVSMSKESIVEKYYNIVDLQKTLTEITDVYIGDGMDIQEVGEEGQEATAEGESAE